MTNPRFRTVVVPAKKGWEEMQRPGGTDTENNRASTVTEIFHFLS